MDEAVIKQAKQCLDEIEDLKSSVMAVLEKGFEGVDCPDPAEPGENNREWMARSLQNNLRRSIRNLYDMGRTGRR